MTFRDGRHLVFPALLVAAVAVGCSSKPATAKAYVLASLTQSAAGGGTCNFGSSMSILKIGTQDPTMPLTDTNPQRVNDGSSQGGSISLDCTVQPSGGEFNIAISATVRNQLNGGGGSMTITGQVDPSTGGTGLHGTFANGGVQYDDTNCTLTFTDMGQAITLANNAPKVAAGRIWGHIDCPQATASGSGQNFTCDASADFVFENCGG
jgi:hypothetical protein